MPITNDFLPFCPTDTGTNLESQAAYILDTSRIDGNQPGVASSKLNNKALRQGNFVASQLAQYIGNKLNQNVLDDGVAANLLAQIYAALAPNDSFALENITFTSSVGANALTLALKTQAGTDPSSTDVSYIGCRSSTLTSGLFNRRSITGALSLTVPSGATLGTRNATAASLYLYALDNAGTIELGIINGLLDMGSLQTSVAITNASNSSDVLYSTVSRSNVPVRLLGRIVITETTAGTWASNATSLSPTPFNTGAITSWTPYTPTTDNFGTITSVSSFWRRVGDSMQIRGSFIAGTPVGAAGAVYLPTGYTIDFTKVSTGNGVSGALIGQGGRPDTPNGTIYGVRCFTDGSTNTKFFFCNPLTAGASSFTAYNANALTTVSGQGAIFDVEVPVTQFA